MFRGNTFTSSGSPCNLEVAVIRKSLITLSCAVALLGQAGSSLAVLRAAQAPTSVKKKVVSTITVTGPSVKCHQWGQMVVALKVQKTVTTGAGKPVVSIKILDVTWPIFPDHTPKSVYINYQALPMLKQETMAFQAAAGTKIENIAGATHTYVSWKESLQAALAKAMTP